MANDQEKVLYSFEGDVESLKQATNEAISLLGQFSSAFKNADNSGNFKASSKSQSEFSQALSGSISQVNKLVAALNGAGASGVQLLPSQVAGVNSAIGNLVDSLKLIQTSSKIDTSDMQLLSSVMNDSKKSFADTGKYIKEFSAAYKNMGTGFSSTVNQVSNATKSAKDSADVFVSAANAQKQGTETAGNAVQDNVRKVNIYQTETQKATDKTKEFGAATSYLKEIIDGFKIALIDTANRISGMSEESNAASQNMSASANQFSAATNRMGDGSSDAADAAQLLGGASSDAAAGIAESGVAAEGAAASMSPWTAAAVIATEALKKAAQAAGKFVVSSVKNSVTKLADSFKDLTSSVGSANGVLSSFAKLLSGAVLGKAIADATKSALDYIENLNLFAVVMGQSRDAGNAFVDTLQEIYGLDPSNIMRTTGTFYQLTAAMEAPTEAARIMSMGLTKAAIDLSSLFNVDFETVAQDLTSGMQGMARSVRKYAMDIRVSTLQQEAFLLGMEGQVETMSETNRQGLRYITMLKQMSNVTGDFANTLESPANQLRVLKEQISQLARAIGTFLVPILEVALPVINAFVMTLRMLLETLAMFFGIETPTFGFGDAEDATEGITGVGDAAGAAAKQMKDLLAPWDKLNILSKDTAKSGGGASGGISIGKMDPKLLAAIQAAQNQLESVQMKANKLRDSFLALFGVEWVATIDADTGLVSYKLQMIPGEFMDQLTQNIKHQDWKGVGQVLANKLSDGVTYAADKISWTNLGDSLTKGIRSVTDAINGFTRTFKWAELGRLLGNGFQTAVNALGVFISEIDLFAIGTGFGKTLNTFLDSVDWGGVGATLISGFNLAIQGLLGFVTTFNWTKFGFDIVNFLNSAVDNADWKAIGVTLNTALRGIFLSLSIVVDEFDWDAFADGLSDALVEVDWFAILKRVGDIILTALYKSMTTALKVGWNVFTGEITKLFTDTGSKSSNSFFKGFNSDSPLGGGGKDGGFGGRFKNEFVTPVANEVAVVPTIMSEVGQDSSNKFQNAVKDLPGWYATNVALPLSSATGSIPLNAADSGSQLRSDFTSSIGNLAGDLNTSVWSEVSVDLVDLSTTADTESKNIDSYYRKNLAQLPSWVESALTHPIELSFTNVTSNATNQLDNLIRKTNEAITAANRLSSATSLATNSPNVKPSGSGAPPPGIHASQGGVITRRTITTGEGINDEAIIPLGNSPQVEQLLEKFADITKSGGSGDGSPIVVKVVIGGTEWDTEVYEAGQRGERNYGAKVITRR